MPHGEVTLRRQFRDQRRMEYLKGLSRLRLIPNPEVPLFQELLARVIPMAWCQEFESHRVTCPLARPVLRATYQRGTDPLSAMARVSHEHAEFSDSVGHEIDLHRANERAVDLSQNQRLSAKNKLDLGGIGPKALPLPHARFSLVIDFVDQVRKSPDIVGSEVRLNREPNCYFLRLAHGTTLGFDAKEKAFSKSQSKP